MVSPVGILTVTVLQGDGMPKMDILGENDTYIKLSVNIPVSEAQHQREADPKLNTYFGMTQVTDLRTPIWNETISFPCSDVPKIVYLEAWDQDRGSNDDLIGQAEIDLIQVFGNTSKGDTISLSQEEIRILWVDLKSSSKNCGGKVQLVLHYRPKSTLERLANRYSNTVESIKSDLNAKIVGFVTDIAAQQIKSNFDRN
jgi:Ca2+-dependent lipid-binding protein